MERICLQSTFIKPTKGLYIVITKSLPITSLRETSFSVLYCWNVCLIFLVKTHSVHLMICVLKKFSRKKYFKLKKLYSLPLLCCLARRITGTIFLDSMYICINIWYLSLFLTYIRRGWVALKEQYWNIYNNICNTDS